MPFLLDRRLVLSLTSFVVMFCAILPVCGQTPAEVTPAERYIKQQQTAQQLFKSNQMGAYATLLAKMATDYPYKSNLLPRLASAYVQLGQTEKANEVLERYAQMGGALAFREGNLKQFRDSGKLTSLKKIEDNAKPVSVGSRVFAMSDPDLLTEDIAHDAKTNRFFLSSVHQRKILSCSNGKCDTFAVNSPQLPLLGVLALRVDAKRRILWASSVGMKAASNMRDEDDGKSALLKFDVDTGHLLSSYEPADDRKHALGDMTLGSDGTAYIADGLSGDVFLLKPGASALDALVPHGTFVSPQTPALGSDGKLLYVPDYTMGIAIIHLDNRRVEWLTSTIPVALDCIDGLYLSGNRLIAIQNGIQPERVASFRLRSPVQIENFKVLEANWQGLGDPTHGVLVGDSFYFIVNSGWDRMDDDGKFAKGTPAEVWKLSLGSL